MHESLYGIYWLPLECLLEVFGVIILVFWGPSSASPAHTQASSLRVASAGCAKRKQSAASAGSGAWRVGQELCLLDPLESSFSYRACAFQIGRAHV